MSHGLYGTTRDGEGRAPQRMPLRAISQEVVIRDSHVSQQVVLVFGSGPGYDDVTYAFPVSDKGTIHKLSVSFGVKRVIGQCVPRGSARSAFDEATNANQSAALVERVTGDVCSVKLGALPANTEVTVRMSMVYDAEAVGDEMRVAIPSSIAARYPLSGGEAVLDVKKALAEGVEGPGAGRYNLSIDAKMATAIRTITSPSHDLVTKTEDGRVTATYASDKIPEGDFVITLKLAEPIVNGCHYSKSALGLTALGAVDVSSVRQLFHDKETRKEIVFLVDCSGSMSMADMGSRSPIELAAEAVSLFLSSLPQGCYFNIIRFGSDYEALFQTSVELNDETLRAARGLADHLRADLGGTELERPLDYIFYKERRADDRRVIVLTDGSVCNIDALLAKVRHLAPQTNTVVHTLGVGRSVSTALVDGLATAGRGTSEYAVDREPLGPKVMRLLRRATGSSPTLTGCEWIGTLGSVVFDAPLAPADEAIVGGAKLAVCRGSTLKVGAVLDADTKLTKLRLTFEMNGEHKSMEVPAQEAEAGVLHPSVGRVFVQAAPAESDKRLESIGTAFGLLIKQTGMIAIDSTQSERLASAIRISANGREQPTTPLFDQSIDQPIQNLSSMMNLLNMTLSVVVPVAPVSAASYRSLGGGPTTGTTFRSLGAVPTTGTAAYRSLSADDDEIDQHPTKIAKTGGVDLLMPVVKLQYADGHWELDSWLINALNLKSGENATSLWATALVVAFLQTKVSEREDEWLMLVEKAVRWMHDHTCNVDELVAQAKAHVE
jgi:hypothetical protein